jgi:hypothetical protein
MTKSQGIKTKFILQLLINKLHVFAHYRTIDNFFVDHLLYSIYTFD